MAPEDSRAPFLRIPWTASLLKRPNTICRVPQSRSKKESGEDSLFADTLKTQHTLRSCISFYERPSKGASHVEEVSTLLTIGKGLDGHANVMHGGIVATILDEIMGVLQTINTERQHLTEVSTGRAMGELPDGMSAYTAYMNVQYKKPVRTPGVLIATAKYQRREGRKEWIYAEIKQRENVGEDEEGEEVVCATAEGLMIDPKPRKNKL